MDEIKINEARLTHGRSHQIIPGVGVLVVVDRHHRVPLVGHFIPVIVRVHSESQAPLFHIGQATDRVRALLCLAQRRQKHPGKNGDDGNDDQ